MSGEGGDHNGDMGFVLCMRLIYRWTSQVVLGNLGIRYEAPKKEVTAPAKDSGYFYYTQYSVSQFQRKSAYSG